MTMTFKKWVEITLFGADVEIRSTFVNCCSLGLLGLPFRPPTQVVRPLLDRLFSTLYRISQDAPERRPAAACILAALKLMKPRHYRQVCSFLLFFSLSAVRCAPYLLNLVLFDFSSSLLPSQPFFFGFPSCLFLLCSWWRG